MYKIVTKPSFNKSLKKLAKADKILAKKFVKAFKIIRRDPFYKSLKTHKVNVQKYGKVFSSSVDGDVRILWVFDENNNLKIIALDTGRHSGSTKIYNQKSS